MEQIKHEENESERRITQIKDIAQRHPEDYKGLNQMVKIEEQHLFSRKNALVNQYKLNVTELEKMNREANFRAVNGRLVFEGNPHDKMEYVDIIPVDKERRVRWQEIRDLSKQGRTSPIR